MMHDTSNASAIQGENMALHKEISILTSAFIKITSFQLLRLSGMWATSQNVRGGVEVNLEEDIEAH